MSALGGSSLTKPWQLNENGVLFLAVSPPRLGRGIIRGPPSIILGPPPQDPHTHAERQAVLARREARNRAEHAARLALEQEVERAARPRRMATRLTTLDRYGFNSGSGEASGSRSAAAKALNALEAKIYLTDARPPYIEKVKPHQQCGICLNLKSHPVVTRAERRVDWSVATATAIAARGGPWKRDGAAPSARWC
ncbi:hypothetical protein C8R43DRAFT_946131 [Mycena crocata]|nr:hypothetical protein C8R43DRAFT_946131 [Mycena crocata]